jgi:Uma2 family endonuclease
MSVRRFSVEEYHRLIELGILTEYDNLELLDGYLVLKEKGTPRHECTVGLFYKYLSERLPDGWDIRIKSGFTLSGSEPEPDLLVVRGSPRDYLKRHPGTKDAGLVIEVADSSLASDRANKGRIYARDGVVCYWIVNVQDRQIEVYTSPSGPTANPAYGQRQDYLPGQSLPFVLDGIVVASLSVDDLLP